MSLSVPRVVASDSKQLKHCVQHEATVRAKEKAKKGYATNVGKFDNFMGIEPFDMV